MTIGLKNLVWFPIENESESAITYGTAVPLAGAIDAQINPNNAEANKLYADDVEWDSVTPDSDYNIEVETVGFSAANLAKLQGHTISDDGGVIVKAGDEPPYGALAFKSEKSKKSGGGYRYVVLYRVKAAFAPAAYHTKEGNNFTRQTGKMTFSAVARMHDGLKQYIIDSQTDPEDFFTEPITPVVTPPKPPAATPDP
ncbi:MAG: hypothetical protein QM308_01755 [Bacillota bacterium]|nr:hypothetical protein [Bacillota bacterium]